jgi:hypothetical protein
VLSKNSLQIVVLDNKKEKKEKKKIIKGELVKGEAIEREKRKYTITPARSIVLIDLIAY